jgi:hypothetical protein
MDGVAISPASACGGDSVSFLESTLAVAFLLEAELELAHVLAGPRYLLQTPLSLVDVRLAPKFSTSA